MTIFLALANFEDERFPSKLVFGEATQVFHGTLNGVVITGVGYRATRGFFYCSTSSQPFPIFIAYSCSWRDCALGEILYFVGNIIMVYL